MKSYRNTHLNRRCTVVLCGIYKYTIRRRGEAVFSGASGACFHLYTYCFFKFRGGQSRGANRGYLETFYGLNTLEKGVEPRSPRISSHKKKRRINSHYYRGTCMQHSNQNQILCINIRAYMPFRSIIGSDYYGMAPVVAPQIKVINPAHTHTIDYGIVLFIWIEGICIGAGIHEHPRFGEPRAGVGVIQFEIVSLVLILQMKMMRKAKLCQGLTIIRSYPRCIFHVRFHTGIAFPSNMVCTYVEYLTEMASVTTSTTRCWSYEGNCGLPNSVGSENI